MDTSSILDIKKLLSTSKKVVIVPHKNPDGDAMGSALGLCLYLKKKGHIATVIAPNDYPEFLKWLPGNDEVINYEMENSISENIISSADVIFFTIIPLGVENLEGPAINVVFTPSLLRAIAIS